MWYRGKSDCLDMVFEAGKSLNSDLDLWVIFVRKTNYIEKFIIRLEKTDKNEILFEWLV